eukprot:2272881-Lingulodinium_polyedra.AAC.1
MTRHTLSVSAPCSGPAPAKSLTGSNRSSAASMTTGTVSCQHPGLAGGDVQNCLPRDHALGEAVGQH